MRRTTAPLASLLAMLAAAPPAAPQCDPWSSETPVPVPPGRRLRCGDGRAGAYAASCTRHCSGGCGHPRRCAVRCDEGEETCDGRDLRGQTCRSLGFAGGALACRRGCDELDVTRCEPCFAGASVTCGALPTGGLGDLSSPRVAARAADAGVVWMATGRPGAPNVFFTALGHDLRPRGPARPVAASNLVAPLAATPEGYLVVSVAEGGLSVHRAAPGPGAVALAWRLPGTFQYADLATTAAGDVLLTTLDGGGSFAVRALDARGAPRPLPAGALHANGWFGRVLVAPLTAGAVTAPGAPAGAAPVTARDGDRLVAWVRASMGACGAGGCTARVDVMRGDERVGGFYFERVGGAALAVSLPGGARVTLSDAGGAYDDEYAPGASGAAPPLRASGAMRARPPEGLRVFAASNVQEPAFAPLGEGLLGAAVFAPTGAGPGEGGAARRLLLVRVRP